MKSAIFALTILGAAIGATSAPALAGPDAKVGPNPNKVVVVYGDLDLNTERGQATLEKRIESAARAVCSRNKMKVEPDVLNYDPVLCYREAKAKAAQRMAAIIEENRLGG